MLFPKPTSSLLLSRAEKIFKELETALVSIATQNNNILSVTDLSRSKCEESLIQLKDLILSTPFKNKAEEIYFFKKVKPRFTSKLIYFFLLYDLERRRIFNIISSQVAYLEKALHNLDLHCQDNVEFYTYYRTDSSVLDDKYFARSEFNFITTDLYFALPDRNFLYIYVPVN